MKFFSRRLFIFLAIAASSIGFLPAEKVPVVENQYEYLSDELQGTSEIPLFNVNEDEMGPAIFIMAQGNFWTVKDIQNALLTLEVMGDRRQVNKVYTDLKKYLAQGPERNLEESLLKNTIVASLKGLGQPGYVFADLKEWRVCAEGIAPLVVQENPLEWVKSLKDPWIIAPKSNTVVVDRQLSEEERAAAVAMRKKFEDLPFPFLYRAKKPSVVGEKSVTKFLWYAGLLYGAWRAKNACSARVDGYQKAVEDPECLSSDLSIVEANNHLAGPAIALYHLKTAVEASGKVMVKGRGNKPPSADGFFWTFEQLAAYKKNLFGSPEKLTAIYSKIFGADIVIPELMKHRITVVLNLLVPSVDYNPNTFSARFSALFNSKRQYLHNSDNGKELRWLYRWAWFFTRTDVDKQCDQTLLGADCSYDDIPKKTHNDVQRLIQEHLQEVGVKPTQFSDVTNAKDSWSVVFYDNRAEAAQVITELFDLYLDDSAGKKIRLFTQHFYHRAPFWRVLYNPSLAQDVHSPLVFKENVIQSAGEIKHLDSFVVAARARCCYPYAYFGFGKFKSSSSTQSGDDVGMGDLRLPGNATRRAQGRPTASVVRDCSYRNNPSCRVCDIEAITLDVKDESFSWDNSLNSVLKIRSDGKIVRSGSTQPVLSDKVLVFEHADVFILAPGKLAADQKALFETRQKEILSSAYGKPHPAYVVREEALYSYENNQGVWISLVGLAQDCECAIEMCTTIKNDVTTNYYDSYSVHLCCQTSADAKKVRAALKDSGLALGTV